jgi:hypothetical protein
VGKGAVSGGRAGVTDKAALTGGQTILAHLALVCLRPEQQAATGAIIDVEESPRRSGFEFYPYAAAFFRRLTGRGKASGRGLRFIPGIRWDPAERLATLSDYDMAFNTLIRTRGEYCPSPLSTSDGDWLFPETAFRRRERNKHRVRLAAHKYHSTWSRQDARRHAQKALQYQHYVGRARIELNFQSPDTFVQWHDRHPELKEQDWLAMFWHWQRRFPSLRSLAWFQYSRDQPQVIAVSLQVLVQDTPAVIRAQERLYVPNKLTVQTSKSV